MDSPFISLSIFFLLGFFLKIDFYELFVMRAISLFVGLYILDVIFFLSFFFFDTGTFKFLR